MFGENYTRLQKSEYVQENHVKIKHKSVQTYKTEKNEVWKNNSQSIIIYPGGQEDTRNCELIHIPCKKKHGRLHKWKSELTKT